jgi:hypothetical protein
VPSVRGSSLARPARVNIAPRPHRGFGAGLRPELVAARLNRSNFRFLIASAPTARETTYAALGAGSTLTPLRAAAHADALGTWFAPSAIGASRFGRELGADLSVDRFSGPAVSAVADAGTVE